MFSNRLSAGIEVFPGGARIALVQTKPSPTVLEVEEILVQPGEEARVGLLMGQVLDRIGARNADLHLAFSPPGNLVRHQLFSAPKLRKAELMALATRELKRDGTIDPAKAYFAVQTLGPDDSPEAAGGERQLLVALQRELVEDTASILLENKRIVRSATTAPMALYRAASVSSVPMDGIVALALLDPRRSSLVVLENGVPRFFRDIPAGFSGREGQDEALVSQALARELDISLVYFAQQHRPKQVETVMVVGDPAVSDRVCEWMEEVPKYRVVRFGASPRLAVDPKIGANLAAFAVAIGTALGPQAKAVPDVLPAQLRGRPEQLVATVAAVVVAGLFLAFTLHQRNVHAAQRQAEEQRAEVARQQYTAFTSKIDAAGKIDMSAFLAKRWKSLFTDHDVYQVRYARLLHGLPGTLPARAKLLRILVSDIEKRTTPGGAAAPAAPDAPNLRMHLEGIVRAGDLSSAQLDLKALVSGLERLPGAKAVELAPIRAPAAENGVLEVPFSVDVLVRNLFPGKQP